MTLIRDSAAPMFIVVWKSGKYKQTTRPGKYEQDADFIVTIPVSEVVPYVPSQSDGEK
jgi:hypothetical protein